MTLLVLPTSDSERIVARPGMKCRKQDVGLASVVVTSIGDVVVADVHRDTVVESVGPEVNVEVPVDVAVVKSSVEVLPLVVELEARTGELVVGAKELMVVLKSDVISVVVITS